MKKGIIFGSILLFIILCGVALWYFFPKAIKISDKSDLIVVSTPVRDSLISSPLSISGRARGTWFFEGGFPLELIDDEGNIIAQGHATAQGEWMTEEFVPFLGTLQFNSPSRNGRGELILKRDNPSGLPEHDDSISVSVIFK